VTGSTSYIKFVGIFTYQTFPSNTYIMVRTKLARMKFPFPSSSLFHTNYQYLINIKYLVPKSDKLDTDSYWINFILISLCLTFTSLKYP